MGRINLNIIDLKSWKPEQERLLTDFNIAYVGYYVDIGGVRYIPYVGVKTIYQGKGFFKILLDKVKEGVSAVVLLNPTDITIHTAEGFGYEYDDAINAMIWRE